MKKVILVTGASRGIGRNIAETLANDGNIVIANYNRSEREASQLEKENSNITIYKADVSKKDDNPLFIKLLFVLLIANIIVTTLNTFVLRIYFPALDALSFMVFYVPRLVEEIIATILQAYIMAYLLKLLNKTKLIKL